MAPTRDDGRSLGAFLQARRRATTPATSGRRRTPGLRREEVAAQANISVDYYTRLEQARAASMPSPAVLDGLAAAFGLTAAEKAYLYRLTGRSAPEVTDDRPSSAMAFLLRALKGTPAQVISDLGYVLAQNPEADEVCPWVQDEGLGLANIYEAWFLHDQVRNHFPPCERDNYSRAQAGELRAAATKRSLAGEAGGERLVRYLQLHSPIFAEAWEASEVHDGRTKTIWLPGPNETTSAYRTHTTIDQATGQRLLAFELLDT